MGPTVGFNIGTESWISGSDQKLDLILGPKLDLILPFGEPKIGFNIGTKIGFNIGTES